MQKLLSLNFVSLCQADRLEKKLFRIVRMSVRPRKKLVPALIKLAYYGKSVEICGLSLLNKFLVLFKSIVISYVYLDNNNGKS